MKLILATQGSQGIVALRELFALGYSPKCVHVAVCKSGVNEPLAAFLTFNQMHFDVVASGAEFDNILNNFEIGKATTLLSIGWRYKFSDMVLKKIGDKAINLHPGLLPEYRGCFSTPWAIINNEKYSGFTYHLITSDFDAGPVFLREEVEISERDTSHSLNYRVMQRALSRLGAVLTMEKPLYPQAGGGCYYANTLPYGGQIDPTWNEEKRERFIRAIYFPPYQPAFETRSGLRVEYLPEEREDND